MKYSRCALLVFGLVIFSVTGSLAQNFKLGIQSSLDISHLNISSSQKDLPQDIRLVPMASFSMNGYLGFRWGENWVISAEPGLSKKGGIIRSDASNDMMFELNYIQLPLMLDYYLYEKAAISLGTEFSYLNTFREIRVNEGPSANRKYNRLEWSLVAGMAFQIGENTDIGARYHLGITSSHRFDYPDLMGNPSVIATSKNNYLQLFIRFYIMSK